MAGEQQQQQQVNPADARAFLGNFGHNPDALKTMPDADVLTMHGSVSGFAKKSTEEAVAAAVAEAKKTAPTNEKWREAYVESVKGDDKLLTRLQRYATPNDAFNALVSVQNKIAAGEFRSALPKDATPEQVSAWRKDNSIPEGADKYELKLPQGVVVADEDKPYIGKFLAKAHGKHVNNEQASAVVEAYYEIVADQQAEQKKSDDAAAVAAHDALVAEWGTEYRPNMNRVYNILNTAPEPVRNALLNKRAPDGKPFMSDPGMLKWLNALDREINPAGTLAGHGGETAAHTIDAEISAIKEKMKDPTSEYFKGEIKPGTTDTVMAIRYRELLAAKERVSKKAA